MKNYRENETKSQTFEKINKIDKSLGRLIRKTIDDTNDQYQE